MGNNELIHAIKFFGSQQRLAQLLKVNRKVVNGWLNKEIQIPVRHALSVEMLSHGQFLAEKLAPYAKSEILHFKKYLLNKSSE